MVSRVRRELNDAEYSFMVMVVSVGFPSPHGTQRDFRNFSFGVVSKFSKGRSIFQVYRSDQWRTEQRFFTFTGSCGYRARLYWENDRWACIERRLG